MASGRNWLREQKPNLVSGVVAFQTVFLLLLVVFLISVAKLAGDSRGSGWSDGALGVSRRNGVDSFLEGLQPRFGRGLLQNGDTNISRNGRPLAVKRGRFDPFKDFHKYRGGYDVKSKHYWGSLVWTGLPGYAIAAAWLVLGLFLLLSVCCIRCWCRRRGKQPAPSPPNVLYFWVAISMAALLTVAAIGGSVVLFVGSREFAVEARKVEHAFKDAASNLTGTVEGLTGAIVNVEHLLEPFSATGSIINTGGISLSTLNTTAQTLSMESGNIDHTVYKNMRTLDKIITVLEIALMVLSGLNLILIIVGPVFVLLHWNRTFYLVVTITWMLTALTAVLFGVSFVLDNLVKDTCDAMNEYRADPINTTLDALLPCEDLMPASGALAGIGQGIRDSISQMNTTLMHFEGQLNASLPELCEQIGPPPLYQYISTCPAGTFPISELPQKLQIFKCSTNDSQKCFQQGKPLTDFQYMEVAAYSTGVQILLNVYPSIGGLTNCSIVVQTFDKLLASNCKPTMAAARLVWDAFTILTISMTLLILWWMVLTFGNRERKEQIFPVGGSPVKNKNEK